MSHSPITVPVSLPGRSAVNYDILIQAGLLSSVGERLSHLHKPCRVLLLTDDVVEALYADTVTASLGPPLPFRLAQ